MLEDDVVVDAYAVERDVRGAGGLRLRYSVGRPTQFRIVRITDSWSIKAINRPVAECDPSWLGSTTGQVLSRGGHEAGKRRDKLVQRVTPAR